MQLTYLCGSHFQCANNTNRKALQVKHCIKSWLLLWVIIHFRWQSIIQRPGTVWWVLLSILTPPWQSWSNICLVRSTLHTCKKDQDIYLFNGIPAFFSGASTRFKKQSKKSNANPHPPPSNQTMYVRLTIFHPLIFMFRDILRKRLHLDIDFYEFAKQRLFLQWKKSKNKT